MLTGQSMWTFLLLLLKIVFTLLLALRRPWLSKHPDRVLPADIVSRAMCQDMFSPNECKQHQQQYLASCHYTLSLMQNQNFSVTQWHGGHSC